MHIENLLLYPTSLFLIDTGKKSTSIQFEKHLAGLFVPEASLSKTKAIIEKAVSGYDWGYIPKEEAFPLLGIVACWEEKGKLIVQLILLTVYSRQCGNW